MDTQVLVKEVASRHDDILKLKSENLSLEEQLKKQNQNMCFKDQIIKELRKDCKKVKLTRNSLLFIFHTFCLGQLVRKLNYFDSQTGSQNSETNSVTSKEKSISNSSFSTRH